MTYHLDFSRDTILRRQRRAVAGRRYIRAAWLQADHARRWSRRYLDQLAAERCDLLQIAGRLPRDMHA